ncbi:MAG: PQQ-binding-like beta-propeller repeat protein, partial [Porticoccaceae bacterium]|nr:PQQ-binding-like beta-propeller repeat protein [Porticoccaceae bacterium]
IENPEARYGETPFMQNPGPLGAHNWQPMAFNPELNLAYIPAQEIPDFYASDSLFEDRIQSWNTGTNLAAGLPMDLDLATAMALRATLKGRLIAWDPITQSVRWSAEHSNAWNGGVLSTAGGLVFQGRLEGEFAAYNAATGEKLWHQNVKSGAASGPGTYEINGEQYVTITTGWGSAYALAGGSAYDQPVPPIVGKVVTFKLGATGTIPDPNLVMAPRTPKAEKFGDSAMIQLGFDQYHFNCRVCHGPLAISSGVLPDLRWSSITSNADAWQATVLGGALSDNGMVSFADVLSPSDAEAVRAYVIKQAHDGAALEAEIAAIMAAQAGNP